MRTRKPSPPKPAYRSETSDGSGRTQVPLDLGETIEAPELPLEFVAFDPGSTTGWARLLVSKDREVHLLEYGTIIVSGMSEVEIGEKLDAHLGCARDAVIEELGLGGVKLTKQFRGLLENRARLKHGLRSISRRQLKMYDLPVATWRSRLDHHKVKKKLPLKRVKTQRERVKELGEYHMVYDNKGASRKIVRDLFAVEVKNDNCAEAICVGAAHVLDFVENPRAVHAGPLRPLHLKPTKQPADTSAGENQTSPGGDPSEAARYELG